MERRQSSRRVLERFANRVSLDRGLRDDEIEQFRSRLPGRLPHDIEELLRFAGGFKLSHGDDLDGTVTFTGTGTFALDRAIACPIALLGDGSGNFWVADIRPTDGSWGAIFFVCHDPPVIAVQASDLSRFLEQVLSQRDRLRYVRESAVTRIWKDDPWLAPVVEARLSADPIVARFAKELPSNFRVADLRPAETGMGFSWGRYGPETNVRRDGEALLFAVEVRQRRGILARLRGLAESSLRRGH